MKWIDEKKCVLQCPWIVESDLYIVYIYIMLLLLFSTSETKKRLRAGKLINFPCPFFMVSFHNLKTDICSEALIHFGSFEQCRETISVLVASMTTRKLKLNHFVFFDFWFSLSFSPESLILYPTPVKCHPRFVTIINEVDMIVMIQDVTTPLRFV